MKKLSSLIFILLIISSFSCKESTEKKTVANGENVTADSLSVSCQTPTIQYLGGGSTSDEYASCSGSTCTFKKSSTYSKKYKLKVEYTLSGTYKGNNMKAFITSQSDSDAELTTSTNSSYFVLEGDSPSKENSKSVTVCVRDLDKCKDAGASDCSSGSSSCNSKYEDTCTISLETNSSSSDSSTSSSSLRNICNILGHFYEDGKDLCDNIVDIKEAFSNDD